MKKLYTLLLSVAVFLQGYSQDTAIDFDITDCDGNTFHLFDELDAGRAVILEFAMVPNCAPCITAGNNIQALFEEYETNNPGMLRWFTMAYDDVYDCNDMDTWRSNNGFTPSGAWVDETDMVSYYGGMGMPTIVVLGGSDHHVYYKHQGYNATVLTNTENAVQEILGIISVAETDVHEMAVYPIPANNNLTISYPISHYEKVTVTIMDASGRLVTQHAAIAQNGKLTEDISVFENGFYVLLVSDNDQIFEQRFQIQH